MLSGFHHSVSLEKDKCHGCTTCLKRCPTEAIRIRDGKACINSEACIDCGECIRVCSYKAKKALFDRFEDIPETKYRIALPPPSLCGQFSGLEDVDLVLQALIDIGFDDVFEVAQAAEIVSEYTRNYMHREGVQLPVISSACPAIVRLIRMRFPYLCSHVMPLKPPLEIASELAKEKALKEHPELKPEDIVTVFISPCPAKASYIQNGLWHQPSGIDYCVSMSDIYFKLLPALKKVTVPERSTASGMIGLSWGSSGGEAGALLNDGYLAADGIENVIRVLEEIDTGHFSRLKFVELNACSGGCVGGAATVENPYIARVRLQSLRRYLPVSRNRILSAGTNEIPDSISYPGELTYRPVSALDSDMAVAMQKMQAIESLTESLPGIDCGSCGAPTCRAFAQDVVCDGRNPDECIVRLRELYHGFLEKKTDDGGVE